jgi:hypothetical protein
MSLLDPAAMGLFRGGRPGRARHHEAAKGRLRAEFLSGSHHGAPFEPFSRAGSITWE